MILKRELHTLSDTETLAKDLAEKIVGGQTLGLIGDLGAGKTTFVRYLTAALGSPDEVSSPTFVLQHIYNAPRVTIEHWDLYRLKSCPDELETETPANVIRVIEWPEHAEIRCDIIIRLTFNGASWRAVEISKQSAHL